MGFAAGTGVGALIAGLGILAFEHFFVIQPAFDMLAKCGIH